MARPYTLTEVSLSMYLLSMLVRDVLVPREAELKLPHHLEDGKAAEGRLGCGVVSAPSPSRVSSCPSISLTTTLRACWGRSVSIVNEEPFGRTNKSNRKSCFEASVQAPHAPRGRVLLAAGRKLASSAYRSSVKLISLTWRPRLLPLCRINLVSAACLDGKLVGATFLPLRLSQHMYADLASVTLRYEGSAIPTVHFLCLPLCTCWRAGRPGQLPWSASTFAVRTVVATLHAASWLAPTRQYRVPSARPTRILSFAPV